MSRAERRTLQAMRESTPPTPATEPTPPPVWASMTLRGLGVERVPKSDLKWFAYQCSTDGAVKVLTPLYDGKLRGESKPAATGRLKAALMRTLGGFEL